MVKILEYLELLPHSLLVHHNHQVNLLLEMKLVDCIIINQLSHYLKVNYMLQ